MKHLSLPSRILLRLKAVPSNEAIGQSEVYGVDIWKAGDYLIGKCDFSGRPRADSLFAALNPGGKRFYISEKMIDDMTDQQVVALFTAKKSC